MESGGKNTEHNDGAEWLSQLEADLTSVEQQCDIEVSSELIERQLRKMPN